MAEGFDGVTEPVEVDPIGNISRDGTRQVARKRITNTIGVSIKRKRGRPKKKGAFEAAQPEENVSDIETVMPGAANTNQQGGSLDRGLYDDEVLSKNLESSAEEDDGDARPPTNNYPILVMLASRGGKTGHPASGGLARCGFRLYRVGLKRPRCYSGCSMLKIALLLLI